MIYDLQSLGINLVDVIMGRGPTPLFVLAVIEGLPDTSYTAALMSGGRQFYQWGMDRYLLAELYDALNLNSTVLAKANGAKKFNIPPLDRPKKSTPPGVKKKVTVSDLYSAFSMKA